MTTRKLQGPLGGDYQTDGNGNAVLLNTYPLTQEDDVPLRLADHEARVTGVENRQGRTRLQLYDEFARYPDGVIDEQEILPLIGGHQWIATGANTPTVVDGALVTGGSGYAVQQTEGSIGAAFCDVEFVYSGGSPSTPTMTIAICREVENFGDNFVHLNFGPQHFAILLQQDNADYQLVLTQPWVRQVPEGEIVRVGLAVNGPVITVYGPYGEVRSVNTAGAVTALAGGGNVVFYQPMGGAQSARVHIVSAICRGADGFDDAFVAADRIGSLGLGLGYDGRVFGSVGSTGQVGIGRSSAYYSPAITFFPEVIFDELAAPASASDTTITTFQPYPAGATVRVGLGADSEMVTTGAAIGGGSPFANNITTELLYAHPAGTPVFVTLATQYVQQLSYATLIMAMANCIHNFQQGEIRLGNDVRIIREAADVAALGSGDKLHLPAELELDGALNHDGDTVGFYNTTPVAKQTGVAVTAEGIHAALVALGLIGA